MPVGYGIIHALPLPVGGDYAHLLHKPQLVADGCMLGGSVRDSVLFRQVTVKPGAKIENCLIMNDTVVGENCELKYVILDKDVVLQPGTKLIGTPTRPVIIKREEKI